MKLKHALWEPTEHSAVCSEHFKEEDFTNRLSEELDRRLKRDEVGISLFPTKHATLFQMTKHLKDLKVSKANER